MITESVSNFLVPAQGTTNALAISQVFSSSPLRINFQDKGLDGVPFRPSGVVIDNTNGTGVLRVKINETGLTFDCIPGNTMQMPYPAPLNHSATITGNNEHATVIFVDYPLIPNIIEGNFAGLTDTQLRASPVPVDIHNAGVPLDVIGPLTDGELRAAPVPVDIQNVGVPLGVTGPLTDSELRAAPVPVTIDSPPPVQYEPQTFIADDAGTIASGAKMISIKNIGAGDLQIGATQLPPGESLIWHAPENGVLDGISYDATGTEMLCALVV